MNPLIPPEEVQYQACGKVDRKPLTTFPQALRLLLIQMSLQKGDISTLEKRGHFYFGLTGSAALTVSRLNTPPNCRISSFVL
jgi:hypothetical protein